MLVYFVFTLYMWQTLRLSAVLLLVLFTVRSVQVRCFNNIVCALMCVYVCVCTYVHVCVPIIIYLYASYPHQRSAEWLTEETLYSSGVSVCPLNAKVSASST